MAFPNCTIEVTVDFAAGRADALSSNFQKSISAECGNWSKNKHKRNARHAVALGLVSDVQEFSRRSEMPAAAVWRTFPDYKESMGKCIQTGSWMIIAQTTINHECTRKKRDCEVHCFA